MLDLPGFGCYYCYYKVVIGFTYVLLLLYCCEPGQDCQKLFAVLNLHKEMQTYFSSTGNLSVQFLKCLLPRKEMLFARTFLEMRLIRSAHGEVYL